MSAQIPYGPKDRFCPYNGKSMARVCHTCPKWVQVKGQHPQNEKEEIDRWDCADAWVPIMLTQLIRSQNGIQQAVESRGNDTIKMVAEGIMRQERQHSEAMGSVSDARGAPQHQVTSNGAGTKLLSAGDN